ncbi:MAG: InlB B-repeat-containing protein [Paludibacteraceae bacterium]|nr:InlB B-repeat-containing protein [Paludibacteraceae bacterium]
MKKILSFILLSLMCSIGNLWAADPDYESYDWTSTDAVTAAIANHATEGVTIFTSVTSSSNFSSSSVRYLAMGSSPGTYDGNHHFGITANSGEIDSIAIQFAVNGSGDHNLAVIGWLKNNTPSVKVDYHSTTDLVTGTKSADDLKWQVIDVHGLGLSEIRVARQWKSLKESNGTTIANFGGNKTINISGVKVWLKPNAIVTYKANGSGQDDVVTPTSKANACPFTWANHAFTGWNTQADGFGTPYAVGDPVVGNITLYAQWVAAFAVTFDLQGHGDAVDAQYVSSGSKVSEPENPIADGYAFEGWYKEAGCINVWDFANDVVSGVTTLYAKWTSLASVSGEIIRATHSGAKTATITGIIGGIVDKNTQDGGKLGSNNHYFGIKLASGTFLAGDVLTIYATTPSSTVEIFGSKSFSSKADSLNYIDKGNFVGNYYTYTLSAPTEWIYLYRTITAGSAMNPTLGYISVSRNPSFSRTVTEGDFGTICLPNAVAADMFKGATLFNIAGKHITGSEVDYIVLEEATGDLVAGRPYIFEATNDNIYAWYNGDAAVAGSHNGLVGTLVDIDAVNTSYYLLANNTIVNAYAGSSLPANRAYIDMASVPEHNPATAPGARIVEIALNENNATDIQNIEGSEKAVKFIENGKRYIQKDGVVYDATGAKVR